MVIFVRIKKKMKLWATFGENWEKRLLPSDARMTKEKHKSNKNLKVKQTD